MQTNITKFHYFLDEAGDSIYFGKGNLPILNTLGVSKYFSIGICTFNEPLQQIRNKILALEVEVEKNPYFKVGSVLKKVNQFGKFFFHATDDIPEVRKLFFDFIITVDFQFEIIITEKNIEKFVKKHNRKEKELYADLLSHLLHNQLNKFGKHIFMVSQRGNTTRQANLEMALTKSVERFKKHSPDTEIKSQIIFDVVNQKNEPLLNFTDYLCWAVQRKYEKEENRFLEFLGAKIKNIKII